MKRRDFLIGGSALLGLPLAGCPGPACVKPSVPGSGELVDVHCHIFNATDLPEERFIKIVVLEHYRKPAVGMRKVEDPDFCDALIALFSAMVGQGRAPTAKEEIAALDEGKRLAVYADDAANDDAAIKAVAEFIRPPQTGIRAVPQKGFSELRRVILEAGEPGVRGLEAEPLDEARSREIAAKAFGSGYDIGVTLRWFGLFTRYRHVLADKLAARHACQGFKPVLLTPALVDFDNWLGQWVRSPLPDQITLMGRIARRKNGPAVHGYVAFDPLHQVLFEHELRRDFDPLQQVARAIDDEGFVGVKVYPPMGFRPTDNDGDVCRLYPESDTFDQLLSRLPQDPAPAHCSPHPKGGSRALSRELDRAMAHLFDLCAQRNACVIAHANESNAAGVGWGAFADPAYWLPVFERWPNLHVCLGHFGHFDARSAAAPVGAGLPEASWEWGFGHYLKQHPAAPVYMDISYFTTMFGKSGPELETYTATLRQWLAKFDPECRHLMFGTDWVMLGIDPSYPSYSATVYNYFRTQVGLGEASLQRLFSANAAAFLGLLEGNAARGRLQAFYDKHGLSKNRLPAFAT